MQARRASFRASLRAQLSAARIAAISDQVIVSLTNFALTLAVGRAFSAEEFAAYGLGLSIALIVQGLQRHAVTIPLMLRGDARITERRRAVLAGQLLLLGAVLAGGLATTTLADLAGIGRYGHLIVLSGAVCLIVQCELEFSRAFLIKTARPWLLLLSAGWYAAVALALSALSLAQRLGYETLLLSLAAAMLLHAVCLVPTTGQPHWRKGILLLRIDLRRYGGWAAAATLTYTGYNHAPLLLLGALAAPLHAAAFVAARSLMQPLQILLRGMDIADKAVFSGAARQPFSRAALTATLTLAALYAAIALVFCAGMGLFAETWLTLAYGEKFSGFGHALLAWIPAYLLLGAAMPLESLVYARKDFAHYFLTRGLASLVAVALSVFLIGGHAETGAILACAAGWLIAVGGTLVRLIRGTHT